MVSVSYTHLDVYKRQELREALQTHSIAKSEKKKIIIAACGGNVPSTLDEMLDLIIKNERQVLIDYIALRYIDLYRERFNIQHGKLVTAVSMDCLLYTSLYLLQ